MFSACRLAFRGRTSRVTRLDDAIVVTQRVYPKAKATGARRLLGAIDTTPGLPVFRSAVVGDVRSRHCMPRASSDAEWGGPVVARRAGLPRTRAVLFSPHIDVWHPLGMAPRSPPGLEAPWRC